MGILNATLTTGEYYLKFLEHTIGYDEKRPGA